MHNYNLGCTWTLICFGGDMGWPYCFTLFHACPEPWSFIVLTVAHVYRYIFFHSTFITQSLQIWSLCDHGQIKQVPKADLRPGHVIHLLPCCIRKIHGWNTWPTTQQPGKWKNKKELPLQRAKIYCSTVFGRIHYVHVSNVTYFRFALQEYQPR